MAAPDDAITSAQLVKLHAAARELTMTGGMLHDLAAALSGKTSLRALNRAEAGRVIDELVKRGASSGRRRRLPANVQRLVSPWQLERLRECISALGWQDARPLVEGVITRAIRRPWPRTSAEAVKSIEAFKAIIWRRFGDPTPREGQQ
jgi:phage gp16-like protein